jgi:hypothetical protein
VSTARFTLDEVGERLRLSLRQVRTLVANNELRAIDVSTTAGSKRPRYVVDESDLEAFENRRATSPAPARQRTQRMVEKIPNYLA